MIRTRVSRLAGCWGALWALLLMGIFLAGCKTGSASPEFADAGGNGGSAIPTGVNAATPNAATPNAGGGVPSTGSLTNDSVDVIRVQDLLTVVLSDTPIPLPAFEDRVKDDGTITLTENQKFNVVGKRRGELADEIHDRYVPRYFRRMTVLVQKKESTQFYYVGGEVKVPARQAYLSRITVLKAIQSVGWFTEYANKTKVQLMRSDGRIFTINCKKALRDSKLDLEVFPGDTITVPRRTW